MFHNLKLKIIQYRKFTYILSLAIIISGLVNIAVHRGLKMGIDFAGGNMLQVEVKDENIGIKDIRKYYCLLVMVITFKKWMIQREIFLY